MAKPPAPDPNGPQPHDWEPRHWIAYTHWATGHTREQTAQASSYSKGHIGHLASKWRKTYNINNINNLEPGITPEIQQAGVEQHAVISRLRWKARRSDLAAQLGDDIEDIRALVSTLIHHFTQPAVLPTLTVKDARDLVAMMVSYTKMADQADDIPDATRALTLTQNNLSFGDNGPDPAVDGELLDGLLGAASGQPQDVLDAVDILAKGFLTEVGSGDMHDHVLDVEEAKAS